MFGELLGTAQRNSIVRRKWLEIIRRSGTLMRVCRAYSYDSRERGESLQQTISLLHQISAEIRPRRLFSEEICSIFETVQYMITIVIIIIIYCMLIVR